MTQSTLVFFGMTTHYTVARPDRWAVPVLPEALAVPLPNVKTYIIGITESFPDRFLYQMEESLVPCDAPTLKHLSFM